MITSRPFFRVDRVLKFASSYDISRPANCFQQGYCSCLSSTFSERMSGAVDRKKRKMVTCMWRPVSTQLSSVEERLIKEDKSEDGNQLEGGHSQEVNRLMEGTTGKTNLTITSSSTKENVKDETLEGKSLHHVGKHSLLIEVAYPNPKSYDKLRLALHRKEVVYFLLGNPQLFQRHPFDLHATVMNARHRKGKRCRKHNSFDARGIFKQFGSEDWGDYLIREAHLSQRFVFEENGYYHCCASIPFPENMKGTNPHQRPLRILAGIRRLQSKYCNS